MNMKSLGSKILTGLALGVSVSLVPELAHATTTTSTSTGGGVSVMADAFSTNFASIKGMALNFGYMAGIILILLGVWFLYKEQKQQGQGHAKNGMVAMFVGAALLGGPGLASILMNTAGLDSSKTEARIQANGNGF
ncbi:hypothetical protein AB6D11_02725 [Vibrio splendidus]